MILLLGHQPFRYLRRGFLLLIGLLCLALSVSAQQSVTLYVGQSQTLSAPNPPQANAALFQTAWASLHASVSVTQMGLGARVTVNSYFTGIAQVRCDYYWYYYVNNVQRTNYATTYYNIYCNGVECRVSPSELTLSPGQGQSLIYTLSPSIQPAPTIRWYSNNTDVATVSSSGYVYAVGSGSCDIICENSAGRDGTCSVYVRNVNPTRVDLYGSSRIKVGLFEQFRAELTPSNVSTTCSWSSSDYDIASVNSTGGVTGKSDGTARITVTTANGLSDYIDVEVYTPVPSSIRFSEGDKRVPVGAQQSLPVSVTPSDAVYKLTWSSDAEHIVEATQQGRITAKSPGTAHITVKTDNGSEATCTITVAPRPDAIALTPDVLELLTGRTSQLRYTLSPADAMPLSYTWTSSEPTVATVSSSGLVTVRKPGEATISIMTDNGCTRTATIVVPMPLYQLFIIMKTGEKTGYLSTDYPCFSLDGEMVHFTTANLSFDIPKDELDCFTLEEVLPEHPTAITLPENLKVGLGRTARLAYELTPADAQTTVTWFNKDDEVATVSSQGIVTAYCVGTTEITAQTSNGLRASCIVTVPEPQWRLFVWHRSGEIEAFDLAEHPEATLTAETLTLSTESTRLEYPTSDILRFTMSDAAIYDPVEEAALGLYEVKDSAREPQFREGDIIFEQLRAGSLVRVYDMGGRILREATADGQGRLRLSITALGHGVFIIKTETSTFKIHQQ